jgi:hypothetical protein
VCRLAPRVGVNGFENRPRQVKGGVGVDSFIISCRSEMNSSAVD